MTYDPFEDQLEEVIQRAQTLRRAHTPADDAAADDVMGDAAQSIVRHALQDRPGPIGVTDTARFSMSDNFRRVLLNELDKLSDGFNLTMSRKQRGSDHDVLKLFGFVDDVHHVTRFVESCYVQAQSAVSYWWLNNSHRGNVELRVAYQYQRGYLIEFVQRLTERVRFAYSIETSTSTSLMLQRRRSSLLALDRREITPLH
jgi:hypothetical protein